MPGNTVSTYFGLAKKIAELQFLNREHVLLFRGQAQDYKTKLGNSTLKPKIFRLENNRVPSPIVLETRFKTLKIAESELLARYEENGYLGLEQVKRHRILRWAILQHYGVCATPLLDVTQSIRIAASIATDDNDTNDAFLYVLGVPNISGAVTASSEAGIQIIRLASACPPDAIRPHLQEGYLLGEYPEIADFEQNVHYKNYEMDFGRRLVAKFRFNPRPDGFWKNLNYPPLTKSAMLPPEHRDRLLTLTEEIRKILKKTKKK